MWTLTGAFIIGVLVGFVAASLVVAAGKDKTAHDSIDSVSEDRKAFRYSGTSEVCEQLTFKGLEDLPTREPMKKRYHKHTKN